MVKSSAFIEKRLENKTSAKLVETIIAAKKHPAWLKVAEILSKPRRKRANINLGEINQKSEEENKIIVPGKILSLGEINKKLDISALDFSDKAKEKLLKSGSRMSSILEEIKKNPEAKEIKILK